MANQEAQAELRRAEAARLQQPEPEKAFASSIESQIEDEDGEMFGDLKSKPESAAQEVIEEAPSEPAVLLQS